jgi:hypothetical protein
MAWTHAFAAQRFSWNKVRYHGGTVQVKVDPWDWNTTITVTPTEITLLFAPKMTARITPSKVRSLSYGQEAKRRVEDVVALSVLLGPFGLFGLMHKTKDELVGIVYDTDDGKPGAVLLESPFALAILGALSTVTGKAIEAK